MTASYGTPYDFIAAFCVFSYIIIDHLCLNCCTSTKLSLIVFLINIHILICQYARCDCKLWNPLEFIAFFANFAHNWLIFMSDVLYYLPYKLYTPFQKKSKRENFEGYFQMRISKWFSNQISEVNTSFCSEKSKF